ncbi:MAG: hypothetical protein PQJ58_11985 [Spirochaetales bacterium]|nr:hypothetical protein [Spirochaetales bacterium]
MYKKDDLPREFWINHKQEVQTGYSGDLTTIRYDQDSNSYTQETVNVGYDIRAHFSFVLEDRTLVMDVNESSSPLYEVAGSADTFRKIAYTGLNIFAAGAVQGNTLVLSGYTSGGSPKLVRVNPATETVETIIDDNRFESLTIHTHPSGDLYVQGILVVDGSSCIMQITPDNVSNPLLDELYTPIEDLVSLE